MSAEITIRAKWDRWDETVTVTLTKEQQDCLTSFLQALTIQHGNPKDRWIAYIIAKYLLPIGTKILIALYTQEYAAHTQVVAEQWSDAVVADARELRTKLFGTGGESC